MNEPIDTLARHVATTRWDDVPESVREHAKRVLLDTLGVILAGAGQPEVRRLAEALSANAGTGATVYTRGWPAADPRTGALLNGIAARSIELCEGHRFVSCQGGAQIVPAVLAVGESVRATGRELILALTLGYDTAVRIGSGFKSRKLAHQNGQVAMLGAIAAGARLRGLDAAATSLAIRTGATLLLTPSYTNAVAGATTLNVAGGMSGFAGALAPELALAGFAAQPHGVEEALGQLVGDGFDPAPVLEEIGTRWEITRNRFRLRACCNPIYPALDALEAGLAELKPAADAIERIDVATHRFASVMRAPEPVNTFAARYSLPHAAAAIIVLGHARHEAFDERALRDPAIAALRARVHVVEDTAMNAMTPRLTPARVTITLKDGRTATHMCDSQRGDFQRPYAESDLREKFRSLAQYALTAEGAAAVEQAVDRCEEWPDLTALTGLLRRHERT